MQSRELAKELGVKKRMVRKYKNDFEQLGIYIDSTTGKYGGYYISRDNSILDLGILEEELRVLRGVEEYLEQESFIFLKEYKMIVDKVRATLKGDEVKGEKRDLIFNSKPNINLEEEKEKYINIEESIKDNKKIKLKYFALKSGLKERVVRPYRIYLYQGFWYMVAHCELREQLRQFKLSRIKELEVLDEGFDKPKDFSLKDYLGGSVGIVPDVESFRVELKIDYPISIKVSERIWVEGQQITFNEDNSINFVAQMTGMGDIVNWILSLGGSVEVIESLALKDRVRKEAKRIFEKN